MSIPFPNSDLPDRSPRRVTARRLSHGVIAALLLALALPTSAHAACDIDSTPCRGCGCKGGPGYRHIATGRCVGFRELAARCGDPPSALLCVFENAPGTGANRDCALAPARPPQPLRVQP